MNKLPKRTIASLLAAMMAVPMAGSTSWRVISDQRWSLRCDGFLFGEGERGGAARFLDSISSTSNLLLILGAKSLLSIGRLVQSAPRLGPVWSPAGPRLGRRVDASAVKL